jgi:hypothetical protein
MTWPAGVSYTSDTSRISIWGISFPGGLLGFFCCGHYAYFCAEADSLSVSPGRISV